MDLKRKFMLIGLALGALSGAHELGSVKLSDSKTDLLAGRLTIAAPAGAALRPMPHDIMSAPVSPLEQSRVVIDAGPGRIVLMATELFARTNGDFVAAAEKQLRGWPLKVSLRQRLLASRLQIVEYVPEAPTTDQDANFVLGAFVENTDRSVQNLLWYANPAAAKDRRAVTSLARTMLDTIDGGSRKLDAAKGERRLCAYSQTKSVFVTLPDGYLATEQRGVDFRVQHIRKLSDLGEASNAESSLGLYLGDYPSGGDGGTKSNGTAIILGKKVEWSQRSAERGGQTTISARTLIHIREDTKDGERQPGGGAAFADVFINASDAATLEELKSIAATLRFGDNLKP